MINLYSPVLWAAINLNLLQLYLMLFHHCVSVYCQSFFMSMVWSVCTCVCWWYMLTAVYTSRVWLPWCHTVSVGRQSLWPRYFYQGWEVLFCNCEYKTFLKLSSSLVLWWRRIGFQKLCIMLSWDVNSWEISIPGIQTVFSRLS